MINFIIKDMAKKIETSEESLPLKKDNYILMAVGFIIVVIGFVLMSGGKSDDPAVFSDAIFSFRRVTLAPMIVLLGFLFEVYAIMKKSPVKNNSEE